MNPRLRRSGSGPRATPNDVAQGLDGQYLSRDSSGFVWSPPPVSPYRVSLVLDAILPNLAAQERGSCVVSLVGTALDTVFL